MMSRIDVIIYQYDSNLAQKGTQQYIKPKAYLPMLVTSIEAPLYCIPPYLS